MPLEPEQIERVREIIRLKSFSATETLVAELNAAQETETISDLGEWAKLRSKFVDVDEKVKMIAAKNRLVIRNRVRERLGLEPLDLQSELNGMSAASGIGGATGCEGASSSVGLEFGW
jgi:hypothetical protein